MARQQKKRDWKETEALEWKSYRANVKHRVGDPGQFAPEAIKG
jgi:hypothetical protein